MPFDLLIRNGNVVTRDGVRTLDIAVEDGRVVELAEGIGNSTREVIDAAGLHVFPGTIDPHVHFNEPGRTEWEGWATGSAALAAGGGTSCFEMPLNANPPTLDGPSFDLKRQAAEASSRVDFGLWGGLTPDNLDTLEELADRGVIGFKAFMSGSGIAEFGRADDDTLRRGMEIAARRGLIVAVHAESETITAQLTAEIRARGGKSWRDYLDSRPIDAEVEAITRAIATAHETGCRLHVVHVSSPEGIAAAIARRDAKRDPANQFKPSRHGAIFDSNVTLETCPHYLLLNEDDLIATGAAAKCAPPVRPQRQVDGLRRDLAEGRIDIVASDHSPAPASMKTGDDAFAIWGGIAGVQSTLASLITLGLPAEQIAMLTATNVAERFGIPHKGVIATGYDADLTLVDLSDSFTLSRDMLLDRHQMSPYVGRQFRGRVKSTLLRGSTSAVDGRSVGSSRGRLLTPESGR